MDVILIRVPDWYVVTGSPSSGTTSTVNRLERLGYFVVKEAARKIIDDGTAEGKTVEEMRKNEWQFQKRVFRLNLEFLEVAPKDRTVFFDNGIPDSLAYYEINGLDLEEVLRSCRDRLYKKVFFLERLPYTKDYARIEDEELAKRIGQLSKKWYIYLGYDIVSIPALALKERVNLILSHII